MRILFLVDSPSSDSSEACGIGDYTFRLAQELRSSAAEVSVIHRKEWDTIGTFGILRKIQAFNADVVHIQYPTIGYLRGFILPFLTRASLIKKMVLTAHEFSQAHPLRRVCVNILASTSMATIFPTSYEQNAFLASHPKLANSTFVIPIGSNISPSQDIVVREWQPSSVIYFGQIRPDKGIEEFIKLVEYASVKPGNYEFTIVGTPHPRHQNYYQSIRRNTSKLPINWSVGLAEKEVGKIMSSAMYAYLPFPDGASERRGSLLAALSNGLVVLTTKGEQTPDDLGKAVSFVSGPTQAADVLDSFEKSTSARQSLSLEAAKYAKAFSWETIALSHLTLYKEILNRSRSHFNRSSKIAYESTQH